MRNWLRRLVNSRQTASVAPEDAAASFERGELLLEQGCAASAEACFRNVLSANPARADALGNLSAALNLQGRFAAAEEAARMAVQLDPALAEAHANLGNTMLYRGRYGAAIAHYMDALQIDAALPEAHIHLALLGRPTPQFPAAARHFEDRLDRRPDSFFALTRLGLAYQASGNLDAAREKFQRAAVMQPALAGPLASLAVLHGSLGCPEQSLDLFRRALAISENQVWRSAYLFFLQYSDRYSAAEVFRAHMTWGERQAALAASGRFDNTPACDRRLRIGYMSGDFFLHPVAQFFEPLLRHHDVTRFESFCYANVLAPDAVTARLRGLSDAWRDTAAMSDVETLRQIRDDGIDILVDLSGHTKGQRVGVLAARAAPLQITYLGYPGTTGLASVDYRIADAICDPPGMTEAHYTEKLLRLDGCFVTYQPPADAPPVGPPPCAEKGHISFGSFNNINKVNAATMNLWARVLQEVPDSRIVIKHFATSHRLARERILGTFAANGIDAGRVTLLSAQPDLVSHLDVYREVDIALDSTPYNGTTTTCEALWMGVPVITLAGDRHCARVGASLLASVGLNDLVATTREGYVAIAAALANDPERLRRLRLTLRNTLRQSPLLDAERFTRGVEAAYRDIWRTWCESGGARPRQLTSRQSG